MAGPPPLFWKMGDSASDGDCWRSRQIHSFSSKADIAALLRKRALGALGDRSDVAQSVLTMRKMGVGAPLKVDGTGHYVLSAVPLRGGAKCRGRPHPFCFIFRLGRFDAKPRPFQWWPRLPPTRRMVRIGSTCPELFRRAKQWRWKMRRNRACRTPRKLIGKCI